MKVVFMGTATFAVPALDQLFEAGYKITGVITQPDMPSGRGQMLQAPPIKRQAFDLHLPVYQPKSLRTDETRALIDAMAPDMIVVVAYGKILPLWLLQFPKYGCINLHGSLLPKYRGAAPVHWAIANGEKMTGVCTMRLDEGLDTGPVYLCDETFIGAEETSPQLYDRLATMGGELMVRTTRGIIDGTLQPRPQDDSKATLAPILKKEHGYIDWNMPAEALHNRVRAFTPWPATVTKFRGTATKILKTAISGGPRSASAIARSLNDRPPLQLEPGTIAASKSGLFVVCGDSTFLEIISIQPENRKPVSGVDFANGARLQAGEKFYSITESVG